MVESWENLLFSFMFAANCLIFVYIDNKIDRRRKYGVKSMNRRRRHISVDTLQCNFLEKTIEKKFSLHYAENSNKIYIMRKIIIVRRQCDRGKNTWKMGGIHPLLILLPYATHTMYKSMWGSAVCVLLKSENPCCYDAQHFVSFCASAHHTQLCVL